MKTERTPTHRKSLSDLLKVHDIAQLALRVRSFHPADLANLMESLPRRMRHGLWRALSPAVRGEVLLELHDSARANLVDRATKAELVEAVATLEADKIADLNRELPAGVVDSVLTSIDTQTAKDFAVVLDYPSDTAGGLMNVDIIRVRPHMSLAAVHRYLRRYQRAHGQLPEHLHSIVVADKHERLLGELFLADAIVQPATTLVESLMRTPVAIEAWESAQAVARLFQDHDLVSAPVVDRDNRPIGRITVDDVMDVLSQSADQSALKPAGLDESMDLFAPVAETARRRAAWLSVNLLAASLAAWVVGNFEATIKAVVAVAVLMPVVVSMGSAAGNQSLALVVRGIALNQVHGGNLLSLTAKELLAGGTNGAVVATLAGLVSWLVFGNLILSLTFGLALMIMMVLGPLIGTILPVLLNALRIDPALAGSVTTGAAVDLVGFFVFLGLASELLA